jgi:uncharacterized membrane protein
MKLPLKGVIGAIVASGVGGFLFAGAAVFHGEAVERVLLSGVVGGIVVFGLALYAILKSANPTDNQ